MNRRQQMDQALSQRFKDHRPATPVVAPAPAGAAPDRSVAVISNLAVAVRAIADRQARLEGELSGDKSDE